MLLKRRPRKPSEKQKGCWNGAVDYTSWLVMQPLWRDHSKTLDTSMYRLNEQLEI